MTATALDRARREFEDALNILHKYSDKHGCSMGVPGEECHERKQVRDTVSRLEAAARLAGRLEQAEYAARESRNAMSLMGLQEFLDHLVDRLRREADKLKGGGA